MNKAKRVRISQLISELEQAREALSNPETIDLENATVTIVDLHDQIDEVKSEEEEVRDNYPENLHNSDIYDTMCAAVDCMEYAMDSLDEATDAIESGEVESAIDSLGNAINSLEEI